MTAEQQRTLTRAPLGWSVPNGAGTTAIFRMITGEESPDEVDVSQPKTMTIGHFRQGVEGTGTSEHRTEHEHEPGTENKEA